MPKRGLLSFGLLLAVGRLWTFCGLSQASHDGRTTRTERQRAEDAQSEISAERSEELLIALGRNLWAAADELLEVSALLAAAPLGLQALDVRKFSPQGLGAAALALRSAADMMLDEDWESAMGELEVAAVSCEGFLPPQAMQGLVDLFAYEEPIPSCEWKAGSRSLRRLSRNLENVISRLGEGEVVNSLLRAAEAFRDAGQLFTGSFKMPPDPRIYRGPRGQTPRDFYGSFYQPPEPQYVEDAPPGSPAGQLLQSVAAELEAETTSEGRRLLLRRLVRKLHPDQNRGKEDEVTPAFRYIQRIRSQEMDQRR